MPRELHFSVVCYRTGTIQAGKGGESWQVWFWLVWAFHLRVLITLTSGLDFK